MPRARKVTGATNNEYMSNGVTITPSIPSPGENVTIMYDGLLSKSGAHHVFAHIGYGSSWENKSFYRMDKTSMGFETTIPINNSDTLNICFKDCANNWDNNTGKNYTFDISQ